MAAAGIWDDDEGRTMNAMLPRTEAYQLRLSSLMASRFGELRLGSTSLEIHTRKAVQNGQLSNQPGVEDDAL